MAFYASRVAEKDRMTKNGVVSLQGLIKRELGRLREGHFRPHASDEEALQDRDQALAEVKSFVTTGLELLVLAVDN